MIYIHIGLPRTGTTFLQTRIFPNLPGVVYNPDDIGRYVDKKVLLSCETFFLDPRSLQYKGNHISFKKKYLNSRIIVCLIYQTDWILSMFKLSIQKSSHQTLNEFLGYENGEFQTKKPVGNKKSSLVVEDIDFMKLLDDYVGIYGRENVLVLFYEDMLIDLPGFLEKISSFMGVDSIPVDPDRTVNKSFSALSCYLLILKRRLFKLFNQEYFADTYSRKILRRLDKFIYIDWDMLKDVKVKLDKKFKENNKILLKYFSKDEIPARYL